jgi:hypothetical protein
MHWHGTFKRMLLWQTIINISKALALPLMIIIIIIIIIITFKLGILNL